MADIRVENYGSVYLLRPMTEVGENWLRSRVDGEATWLGNAVACEGRFLWAVVEGAQEDGLEVQLGGN